MSRGVVEWTQLVPPLPGICAVNPETNLKQNVNNIKGTVMFFRSQLKVQHSFSLQVVPNDKYLPHNDKDQVADGQHQGRCHLHPN